MDDAGHHLGNVDFPDAFIEHHQRLGPGRVLRVVDEGLGEAHEVWRAQVNAYPDERSAKQIVDRLKNKGYNAYVTEVQNNGKTWFRVSVGKYSSRGEADKAVEALMTKENFPKAFASSK